MKETANERTDTVDRKISSRATLALLATLALALPGSLAAASAPAADDAAPRSDTLPGLSETIDVRVINVDAVVTDRSGARVYGLEPDDFRLIVDGREVPIDYFSEIRDGDLVASHGDGSGIFGAKANGSAVPMNYLLFIDDYFSIKQDRDSVIDNIEETLTRLRPEDRMAIVAFNGKRTEMLTSWTSDHDALRQALESARQRPAYGLERYAELRDSDKERKLLPPTFSRFYDFQLTPLERNFAQHLTNQVRSEVNAATATLQGFAAPTGRKVAILLSGGWPFSPAEYTVETYYSTFEDTTRANFDAALRGRAPLYDSLTDTANLLGYTLYPVDVPGMRPLDNTDVDASRALPRLRPGGAFEREQQTQRALVFLAHETGGEALLNSERNQALGDVVNDTRSHYWLGFSARRVGDGERHDIDVEVTRPGLRVRTREDFVDLTRDTELDLMAKSALLFGNPASDSNLDLQLSDIEPAGHNRVQLPIKVGVPMDQLSVQERNGHYLGDLEVRFAAMDKDGNMSNVDTQKVAIDENHPPASGARYWLDVTLQLRPGTNRLVVVALDPHSGKTAISLVELEGTT